MTPCVRGWSVKRCKAGRSFWTEPDRAIDAIANTVRILVEAARAHRHRYGIVLAGPAAWGRRLAQECLATLSVDPTLWIGAAAPGGVHAMSPRHAHQGLGAEFEALVYDAHSGFDPDAFGAVTGTLRGGGVLLLLTPPLAAWPHYPDPGYARFTVAGFAPKDVTGRFLGRLARVVERSRAVLVLEPIGGRALFQPTPATDAGESPVAPPCRTHDQARAVDAVVATATGRPGRPLVLVADRGRGKSAALGIAAARLLQAGVARISVTAPRLDAAAAVFRHAAALLPRARVKLGALRYQDKEIVFVPPDTLAGAPAASRLLLVDEAAAIPAPLLMRLLESYPRIVFATTVHGYEGSGQGFAVRFQSHLEQRRPGGRTLRLQTPVRWAINDPLERFVSDALLLEASPVAGSDIASATPVGCEIVEVDRDRLAADEMRLAELFGLLITAHYRTRPSDLRNLLDGPNVRVFVTVCGRHTVATALLAIEGEFDPATARAVWAGRRRPRGHLLAQSLCAHVGIEDAATRRVARIMRIAVHPDLRRRGFGRALVNRLAAAARGRGCDLIGSCFGATPDLLKFWAALRLMPVQIGVSRNAASGAHSITVLRALSRAGVRIYERARGRFAAQLPHLLGDSLRDLEPDIARAVLRTEAPRRDPGLAREDWDDLVGYAFAARGFELTLGPISSLVRCASARSDLGGLIDARQCSLLVARVMQKHPWPKAATIAGYSGKAQAQTAMREALRCLVHEYGDERVHEAIRELG